MSLLEEMHKLGYTPVYMAPLTAAAMTDTAYWIGPDGQRVSVADLAAEVAQLREQIRKMRGTALGELTRISEEMGYYD